MTIDRWGSLKGLRAWLGAEIAGLYPGSFALVMATGIISNAMLFEGHFGWSRALFAVNLVAYPLLLLLTILRSVRFWSAFRDDLTDPGLVFSFFTIVAATAVLGTGLSLRGFATAASALWVAAFALWLVLIYFSFGVLIFAKAERGAKVVHGSWLNAIVGTESLVLLGAVTVPVLAGSASMMFVLLHALWGIGLALYAIFIVLFAYHLFFFDVDPEDLSPLLWVVMGAAAIATNAGSVLIRTNSGVPFLTAMRPFIDGVTLLLWAWATWWIPLLLLLGIWKHGVCRLPLVYTPQLWSLVFPLGMYAVATLHLSLAADFPQLQPLSAAMTWIALAVWIATGIGFGWTMLRSLRGSVRGAGA